MKFIIVGRNIEVTPGSVSYTHLTLPTNREGEISVGAGSLNKKKVKEMNKIDSDI